MMSAAFLNSGSGFWQPLIWLGVFIFVYLIVLLIRSWGNKEYKPNSEQTQPFLSGNHEADSEKLHIGGSHLYWGYLTSLKKYYEKLVSWHTGNTGDYLIWMFVVLAVTLVLGLMV